MLVSNQQKGHLQHVDYRKKLWSPHAAQKALAPMMPYVNILITTIGDTRAMLGIEKDNERELAETLLKQYPLDVVALTMREGASVLKCRWNAVAQSGHTIYTTREFEVDIIDQVGRGDAFAAGFLAGYLPKGDVQLGLDYGVAFSTLKHSIPGDLNWCTQVSHPYFAVNWPMP